MKKSVIIVASMLLIAVGLISFVLYYFYDRNNFGEEIIPYTDEAYMDCLVTAEYKQQKIYISPYNRYDLFKIITRGSTERKRIFFSKEHESYDSITVNFDDHINVTVHSTSMTDDSVFIVYNVDGKEKCYSVSGYNTFEHLVNICSGDGSNGNLLIGDLSDRIETEKLNSIISDFIKTSADDGIYSAVSSFSTDEVINQLKTNSSVGLYFANRLRAAGQFNDAEILYTFSILPESDSVFVIAKSFNEITSLTYLIWIDSEYKITSLDILPR